MKTIPKSQYLLLKMKENYETNLKNQTVEITDEEYDNLIQYNTINIDDNNNLLGARLVYKNGGKNKETHHIIYGDNSYEYENSVYLLDNQYNLNDNWFIVFNDGTFKRIDNSELLFKLKNNIGELRKKYNNNYNLFYNLYYIYPNKMNSDIIQETIIASYKGLTCEFCDINVYNNENYLSYKSYFGTKPIGLLCDDTYKFMTIKFEYDNCSIKLFSDLSITESLIIEYKYKIENGILNIYSEDNNYENIKIIDYTLNDQNFSGYFVDESERQYQFNFQFIQRDNEYNNLNRNTYDSNIVLPHTDHYDFTQFPMKTNTCKIFTGYGARPKWFAFEFKGKQQIVEDDDPLQYKTAKLGCDSWFSLIDDEYYNEFCNNYPMKCTINIQLGKRKSWNKMLSVVNSWIKNMNDNNELYIITGVQYYSNDKVPYVILLQSNPLAVIALNYSGSSGDDYDNFDRVIPTAYPIDTAEMYTNMDFFCNLDDSLEEMIEGDFIGSFSEIYNNFDELFINENDFYIDQYGYNIGQNNDVSIKYCGDPNLLTEINIPETVEYEGTIYNVTCISKYAFKGCNNLTEIIIPSNITRIDTEAFYGCTNLHTVEIHSSQEFDIYNNHIFDYTNLSTLYVTYNTIDYYKNNQYISENNVQLIIKGEAFLKFDNSNYLDQTLMPAMDSLFSNVFCRIWESAKDKLSFQNNQGITSTINLTAQDAQNTKIIGHNNSSGVIVGYGLNGTFNCYDALCPNCYNNNNEEHVIYMNSSGIATCPECNKQYDLTNNGLSPDGYRLNKYFASTSGPNGTLIINQNFY